METQKTNGAVVGRVHSDITRPISLGTAEGDLDSEYTMLLEDLADAELLHERTLTKRGFIDLAAQSRGLAKMALSMRPDGQDRQATTR